MILVKIGGGKTVNREYIARDVATIAKSEQVVVVHGASATRDEIALKLGLQVKTITSPSGVTSVYTDQAAMDVFLMTYCGLINKMIVATFQKCGVNAVGLSGIDGRLLRAKRKEVVYSVEHGKTKLITGNLTGSVEKVNVALLHLLLEAGYVPVICPPALGTDGSILNTDNDGIAAVVAGALHIKKLVSLFEAPGFLKNSGEPKSVLRSFNKSELDKNMEFAKGRMKKKLVGAKRAFELGVEHIYWGDGRIEHPVTSALAGKGTVIS